MTIVERTQNEFKFKVASDIVLINIETIRRRNLQRNKTTV